MPLSSLSACKCMCVCTYVHMHVNVSVRLSMNIMGKRVSDKAKCAKEHNLDTVMDRKELVSYHFANSLFPYRVQRDTTCACFCHEWIFLTLPPPADRLPTACRPPALHVSAVTRQYIVKWLADALSRRWQISVAHLNKTASATHTHTHART